VSAVRVGGEYVEGGPWNYDRIEVEHGGWHLVLDTYFSAATKTTYTRLRAPYHSLDRFRFTLYRRGWFSDVAKWLGMQDLEIGDEHFDRDFICKANDAAALRRLLAEPRVRQAIAAQPQVYLTSEPRRMPADEQGAHFELGFWVPGVIGDVDRLEQLFVLFAETLDRLGEMGSAAQEQPG
jgi:hypothetical protein